MTESSPGGLCAADPAEARAESVRLTILWHRLQSAVDEAAGAMVRTAFSTIVRESGDYACLIADARGRSLVLSSRGIAPITTALSTTTAYVLRAHPAERWRPGDVVITNDPWYVAGHAGDVATVSPIFRGERLVGFATVASHVPDVGGLLAPADARETYEEGLILPPVHLYRDGEPEAALFAILRQNVRTAELVIADIEAQISAAQVCRARVLDLMSEYSIDDLDGLATEMIARSERMTREAIARIPAGRHEYELTADGLDQEVRLRLRLSVEGEDLVLDFTGSSPQVNRGVNCVLNYTRAYSIYSARCVLDPEGPTNDGSFRPFRVVAPEGCILNARFPAPVYARSQTGHYLGSLVMGALAKALPEEVIAESGSPSNRTVFAGTDRAGKPFNYLLFTSGGMGASAKGDGLSCAPFPSNTGSGSIEVAENVAPILFWRKALRTDSGGPGRFRGGLGQDLEVEVVADRPIVISTRMDRMRAGAAGLFGGGTGAPAGLVRNDGAAPVAPKGRTELQPGDRLVIRTPGGGGYGPPGERPREAVETDLAAGYVSAGAGEEQGEP